MAYDLEIKMRGHVYIVRAIPDEAAAHRSIRDYLLAWGINILVSDGLRDITLFAKELADTGAFRGNALDAEITVTRTP